MATTNTKKYIIDIIKQETGFSMKHSPIIYLGFPLYIAGEGIICYSGLVHKLIKRITGWQSKILSTHQNLYHLLILLSITLKESLLISFRVVIKKERSTIGLCGNFGISYY